MRLALYQPEIPQNAGTLIRLGACLGVGVDIIEPCSFILDHAHLKRAGMDYIKIAAIERHQSWSAFQKKYQQQRIVLLDTKASLDYLDFHFNHDDVLLVGRESDGVPPEVYGQTNAQLKIKMLPSIRSLNVAIAASIVLGEALRQLKGKEC